MTKQQHNKTNLKRDNFFWITIITILLFSIFGIGIDIDLNIQKNEINIPNWYFYWIITVDAIIFIAILLMFLFKKIGVIIFPAAVLAHFFSNIYFLGVFLYADLMTLFVYFVPGLLYFIPIWDKMK